MPALRFLIAWTAAVVMFLVRWSCRVRNHDDPRPELQAERAPYVYAILHCHQLGAVVACEAGTGAMVSRSADGDLLVPSLRVHGIIPIRGSTRHKGVDKGGADALDRLIEHVRGGAPGYLAVDGPRGPRNHVHRGIARIAQSTGAAVVIAVPVPRRRWILERTWDRFQIPKPFTRIDVFYGTPLRSRQGEDVDAFCARIAEALMALEERNDPDEAALGKIAAERRRERLAREAGSVPVPARTL